MRRKTLLLMRLRQSFLGLGENAKVVLTGDPQQIDNMYLDANSNGLTYLIDAFKGQRLHGHVTLQKTERSELAELAASLL